MIGLDSGNGTCDKKNNLVVYCVVGGDARSLNCFFHSVIPFTVIGGAYGTAKSAIGISSMGVMKPELVMKAVIPVIFAGIIGIYGLIVCVILLNHSMSFLPL